MVECKFSLELTKNGVQKSVHAKVGENESRKLLITLTEKGKVFDLIGHSVVVFFDDKTKKNLNDVNGNVVEFVLPSFTESGERLCELRITKEKGILYSPVFSVVVEGSIGAEAEAEAKELGEKITFQEIIPNLAETTEISGDSYVAINSGADSEKIKVKDFNKALSHDKLTEKDKADQHPIEAISELRETLDALDGMQYHILGKATQNQHDISALNKTTEELAQAIGDVDETSHSHSNKNVLDKLSESSGKLTFNGNNVGVTNHSELAGRNTANQHSMGAITGLVDFKNDTTNEFLEVNSTVEKHEEEISEMQQELSGLNIVAKRIEEDVEGNKDDIETIFTDLTNKENSISSLKTNSHSHSNTGVLANLNVNGNDELTYKGVPVGGSTDGGGGSASLDTDVLAVKVVATLLRESDIYVYLEPLTSSFLTNMLSELLYGMGIRYLLYVPGVDEIHNLTSWVEFEPKEVQLRIGTLGIMIFKGDMDNGTVYYKQLSGEAVRQLLINGLDSVTGYSVLDNV